jgi:dUTP pyrophosphatase
VALRRGDLIAQLLVQRVARARFVEVVELPSSVRGSDGHGSTGGIKGWLDATEPMKEQA